MLKHIGVCIKDLGVCKKGMQYRIIEDGETHMMVRGISYPKAKFYEHFEHGITQECQNAIDMLFAAQESTRTLAREVLAGEGFGDLPCNVDPFIHWVYIYNAIKNSHLFEGGKMNTKKDFYEKLQVHQYGNGRNARYIGILHIPTEKNEYLKIKIWAGEDMKAKERKKHWFDCIKQIMEGQCSPIGWGYVRMEDKKISLTYSYPDYLSNIKFNIEDFSK